MTSANEQIVEQIRKRAIRLERFAAGERRAVLKLLDRLFGELRMRIMDMEDGAIRATDFQMAKLRYLFERTDATIKATYAEISGRLEGSLASLADIESQWAMNAINGALNVKLITMTPIVREQIMAAASEVLIEGAPSREWWSRQENRLITGFKDQMRKGYLQGETNYQLLKRLKGGVDGSGNAVFDLSKGTKRGAEAVIRTSVQAVANDARMRLYRENSDVIRGVMWVSTLDTRTTLGCAARDGLMWDLDGNPIGHNMSFISPPAHWNCRSVLTPITRSFREMGIDSDEVSASTRASIDGQVPEKMTFERWLKGRNEEDIIEVFGPKRAKLWKEGKLSVRDMVDQRGRPLTLEELRKQG
ncbi:MAG TPA: minor capsid protein [Methanomassiliicoccaceae archaeon]|nr:minor capsid protein [Methanomassiliicoccaceae archaeon]